MPFWLEGWTGDNAGDIVGREPNTLLLTLTDDGQDFPDGLWEKGEALEGMPWYWMIGVTCLTPGARSAIATDIKYFPHAGVSAFAIEVAEIAWGGEEDLHPWEPGVHLFAVDMVAYQGLSSATTLATAVIHPSVKRMSLEPGKATSALLSYTQRLRQRTGVSESGRRQVVRAERL
jgi:hypothetical protein